MKNKIYLMLLASVLITASVLFAASCKTVARAAAKYWTNRQIREFIGKCEDKSSLLLGSEKAHQYCDCAVDLVAEKYRDYESVKKASLADVLQIAKDCK